MVDVMDATSRARKRVLELSLLGLRQVDIAERLGVTQGRVSQLLSEARREWLDEGSRTYEAHLTEQLARLELLLSRLECGIDLGDSRSIDSAIRIVERISRLLGLDHRDRMSERTVRVEEARVQIMGQAVASMLDHLGVTGERRVEAIQVLQGELERAAEAS